MAPDNDFRAAQEVGKIFNAILDKKSLCDFFLDSASSFLRSSAALLYLSSSNDQIWLESKMGAPPDDLSSVQESSRSVTQTGKPSRKDKMLVVPLIVRSGALGAACFLRAPKDSKFNSKDEEIAFAMASDVASALKNIFLYEDNVRMERLATVGQTTGTIMHEIKNIAQVVKLSRDFIEEGVKNHNEKFLARGLETLGRFIDHVDGFVWDMMTLTRDCQLQPQRLKIQDILAELHSDLKEKADDLRVRLDFKIDEPFDAIHADKRALYRALFNLIKNAMEACNKAESWVNVRIKSIDEKSYEIAVTDNGQGMNEETRAKIFQPFFSTKGNKGTGLGALIVSQIVKKHQGTIQLESAEGHGTTFRLTLPKTIITGGLS